MDLLHLYQFRLLTFALFGEATRKLVLQKKLVRKRRIALGAASILGPVINPEL